MKVSNQNKAACTTRHQTNPYRTARRRDRFFFLCTATIALRQNVEMVPPVLVGVLYVCCGHEGVGASAAGERENVTIHIVRVIPKEYPRQKTLVSVSPPFHAPRLPACLPDSATFHRSRSTQPATRARQGSRGLVKPRPVPCSPPGISLPPPPPQQDETA